MKIKFELDGEPEELRKFFGVPDFTKMFRDGLPTDSSLNAYKAFADHLIEMSKRMTESHKL